MTVNGIEMMWPQAMGILNNGGPPGMGGWDPEPDRFRLERNFFKWVVWRQSIPRTQSGYIYSGFGKDKAIAKCVELQLQGFEVDMKALDG